MFKDCIEREDAIKTIQEYINMSARPDELAIFKHMKHGIIQITLDEIGIEYEY